MRIIPIASPILLAVTLLAAATDLAAQWRPTSGPTGAEIISIGGDRELWIGTLRSGVFRSTDDGATWSGHSEGLPMRRWLNIQSIDITGDSTRIATDSALYMSRAGGPFMLDTPIVGAHILAGPVVAVDTTILFRAGDDGRSRRSRRRAGSRGSPSTATSSSPRRAA